MPTYQYACTACQHRFEAVQKFTDASLTECPECTGKLRKLYSSVGVVFKGSGFYRTDSRSGAKAASSTSASDSGSSDSSNGGSSNGGSSDSGSSSTGSSSTGSSSTGSSSTGSAKSESKPAAKSGSKQASTTAKAS